MTTNANRRAAVTTKLSGTRERTPVRVIKKIICSGYGDADKSAVALRAERKITGVMMMMIVTRVEGSNEIIITVIYIINVS